MSRRDDIEVNRLHPKIWDVDQVLQGGAEAWQNAMDPQSQALAGCRSCRAVSRVRQRGSSCGSIKGPIRVASVVSRSLTH
jgi:hypothetical protein